MWQKKAGKNALGRKRQVKQEEIAKGRNWPVKSKIICLSNYLSNYQQAGHSNTGDVAIQRYKYEEGLQIGKYHI